MNGQVIQSDKGYSYIQYSNGNKNINGLKVKIDQAIIDMINDTGGLTYDMFKNILNNDVDEIYILFTGNTLYGEVVAVRFKGPTKYKNSVTMSGGFMKYIKEKLDNEEITYQTVNTLDTIVANPDWNLNFILENYINPTSVNGIGIYIDDREIKYNDKIVSTNQVQANRAVQKICADIKSLKPLRTQHYSMVEITVRKPNPMGMVVGINLYDMNNKPITYGHKYCADELGHYPSDKEYDNYRMDIERSITHQQALRLNKQFNRLKRQNRLTDEQKQHGYEQTIKMIEYLVDDDLNKNYRIHTDYVFLDKLLNNSTFKFKK